MRDPGVRETWGGGSGPRPTRPPTAPAFSRDQLGRTELIVSASDTGRVSTSSAPRSVFMHVATPRLARSLPLMAPERAARRPLRADAEREPTCHAMRLLPSSGPRGLPPGHDQDATVMRVKEPLPTWSAERCRRTATESRPAVEGAAGRGAGRSNAGRSGGFTFDALAFSLRPGTRCAKTPSRRRGEGASIAAEASELADLSAMRRSRRDSLGREQEAHGMVHPRAARHDSAAKRGRPERSAAGPTARVGRSRAERRGAHAGPGASSSQSTRISGPALGFGRAAPRARSRPGAVWTTCLRLDGPPGLVRACDGRGPRSSDLPRGNNMHSNSALHPMACLLRASRRSALAARTATAERNVIKTWESRERRARWQDQDGRRTVEKAS